MKNSPIAWTYLPILKWKQGERRALQELTPQQWQKIVPLVELPSLRAAPELAALRAALPEYVAKIGREVAKAIPEAQPVGVDVRWIAPSYAHQARLLRLLCDALSKASERPLIPAITETMLAANALELAPLAAFSQVILRLNTQALEPAQVGASADILSKAGVRRKAIHLVLDQQSIVNEDPGARFDALRPYVDRALGCGCASVTVAGGSFPVNLMGYKEGIHHIARVEWHIWRKFAAHAEYSNLRYADYTVTNPGPVPEIDPRQVNPSVAIRYAGTDQWHLFKARGFKKGPPDQYRGLCTLLITDPVYAGAGFSYGDACYDAAARGQLNNGNPSSWRRDATSHHLVLTALKL